AATGRGGLRGLKALRPIDAMTSRLIQDARLALLLESVFGVVVRFTALPPGAGEHCIDAAGAIDPGTIGLVHLSGALTIGLDLDCWPSLRIVAGDAGADPQSAPAALRHAIATALLAPFAEGLGLAGLGAWRVASVRRKAVPGTGHHAVPSPRGIADDETPARWLATFDAQGQTLRFVVSAPRTVLAMLLQRLDAVGPPPPVAEASAAHDAPFCGMLRWPVRVPGRILLGARPIAIATLEALRPGDVILNAFSQAATHAHANGTPLAATVAWGTPLLRRVCAAVDIDGRLLTLTKEPIMSDDLSPTMHGAGPVGGAGPIELGALDLPVQFEIETVTLPLAQLSALRPGYVIELDTPVAEAQIRIVAHGQTIGVGELITVGEHLGVRVLQMAHDDGSDR
ncbi:MAG: type III secretion system cytoplasmic ring protein SctQ, partial [Janthinobacterium lividum]